MTILQKLKLMVVQCAAGRRNAGKTFQFPKPRRSAKKVHVMYRFRGLLRRGDCSGTRRQCSEESRGLLKQSLADLFASPQTAEDEGGSGSGSFGNGRLTLELVARRSGACAGGGWRIGSAVGLRCRLLRRAWRPVLVAIPESDQCLGL